MASNRLKRHFRLRKKIEGTAERPRLSVYRSLKGVYAQIIDDEAQKTLLGVGSIALVKAKKGKKMTKKEQAYEVGKEIASKALALNIKTIVFDRGGNQYHGRVEELARGAREGGLVF